MLAVCFFLQPLCSAVLFMLPANIAVAIYMMTGAADVPSTSRTSAASGEESVAAPAAGPAPVLSPTSDSGDATEPAMEEERSITASPNPAEPAPAVPEAGFGGRDGTT